jgi:hypothetical protein
MGKAKSMMFVLMGLFLFVGCAEEVAPTAAGTPGAPTPAGHGRSFKKVFENIDPCKLLTTKEVGQALGQNVTAGKRTHELVCTWAPSKEGGVSMTLTTHGEGRNPRGICSEHVARGERVKEMGLDSGYSKEEGLAVFTQGIDHACVIINTIPPGEIGLSDMKGLMALVLDRPPFSGDEDDQEEEGK